MTEPNVPATTTPAATAAAPPAMTIPPDTLIPVPVDGKIRMEPFKKVVESYMLKSAAQARFEENNRLLVDNRAKVEFADRFSQRVSTPEGAQAVLEELRASLSTRLGRPIRLPGEHASSESNGDADDPAAANTRRLEDQVRALEARINRSETTTLADAGMREVNSAVDEYPFFRADKEARELAVMTIVGMKGANPSVSVSDFASELHTRLQGMATRSATASRDELAGRAATLASVPSGSGTPALTDREPPLTRKDLKPGADGKSEVRRRIEAYFNREATAR